MRRSSKRKSAPEEHHIPDAPPELPMPVCRQSHDLGSSDSLAAGLVSRKEIQNIGKNNTSRISIDTDLRRPMTPHAQKPRNPPPIQTNQEMLESSDRTRLREDVLNDPSRLFAATPALLPPYPMSGDGMLRMAVHDQRHSGKPDAKPHHSTRQLDPSTLKESKNESKTTLTIDNQGPLEDIPLEDESSLVTGFPLVCLMIGLMLAVFLISIDRTIISTVSES